ncbi:MAG TPA: hypothetical protein VIJ89_01215, partial [Deferrimonas sp.]
MGARIPITVRKIWLHLSPGYPRAELFGMAYRNLKVLPGRVAEKPGLRSSTPVRPSHLVARVTAG